MIGRNGGGSEVVIHAGLGPGTKDEAVDEKPTVGLG